MLCSVLVKVGEKSAATVGEAASVTGDAPPYSAAFPSP